MTKMFAKEQKYVCIWLAEAALFSYPAGDILLASS